MGSRSRFTDGNIQFFDDTYHAAAQSGVWATCPLAAINGDPQMAYVYDSNWVGYQAAEPASTTLAGYTVTAVTSGSVAMSDEAGAALTINAGTTATQGLNIQKISFNFLPVVDKPIWFETMVKTDNLVAEMFFGLSLDDTTILNGSANTSTDHIGWQCVTDDGVLLFSSEKVGTGDTEASTTMVAGTYVRLGFKVSNASATTLKVEHWVNDTKQSTTHTNANVPIVALAPSWVVQGGGTGTPHVQVAYTKCVQIR